MIGSMRLAVLAAGSLALAAPSFALAADVIGALPASLTGVSAASSFAPSVVSVPEPATWVLLVGGSLGVGYLAQRRRKPTTPKT